MLLEIIATLINWGCSPVFIYNLLRRAGFGDQETSEAMVAFDIM